MYSLCPQSTVFSSNPVTGEEILASTVTRRIKLKRSPVQQTTGIVSFHDCPAKDVSVIDIYVVSSLRSVKRAPGLQRFYTDVVEPSKYEPWIEDQKNDILRLELYEEQLFSMSIAIKTAVVGHTNNIMVPPRTVTKIVASYKNTLYDASTAIDQLTTEEHDSVPNGSRIPFWDLYDLVVSDPGIITKVIWLCPDFVTTESEALKSSYSALVWCAVVIFENGVGVLEMQITRQINDVEVTEPANIYNVTSPGTPFTAAKIVWYVEGKYDMCAVCPIHLHIALYRQNAGDDGFGRSVFVFFNKSKQADVDGEELSLCFSPNTVAYPIHYTGRNLHSVMWKRLKAGVILAVILEPPSVKGVTSSETDDYQVDIYALSSSTPTDVGISNLLQYNSMTIPLTQSIDADVSRKKKYAFKGNENAADTLTKVCGPSCGKTALDSNALTVTDVHKISTLLLWEIRRACGDSYTRTYSPGSVSHQSFQADMFTNFLVEMHNLSSAFAETGGDQVRFIHVNSITGDLYTYSFTYSDYSAFASTHHPRMNGATFNKMALSPFIKMFGTIRRICHVRSSNSRDVSKIFVTKPPLNSDENLANALKLSVETFSKYALRSRRWIRLLCFSVTGAIALLSVPFAGQKEEGFIETIFSFGNGSPTPYGHIKKPLDVHRGIHITPGMPLEILPLVCCLQDEQMQKDVAVVNIYHTTKEGDLPLSQAHVTKMTSSTNSITEEDKEEYQMFTVVMGLHECGKESEERENKSQQFECNNVNKWRQSFIDSMDLSVQKPRYVTIVRFNIEDKGNQIFVMVWDCKKRFWGIARLMCDATKLIESLKSDQGTTFDLNREGDMFSDLLPGVPGAYSITPLIDFGAELRNITQWMLSFDGTRHTLGSTCGLKKTPKTNLENIAPISTGLYIASVFESGSTKAVLLVSWSTAKWCVLYVDNDGSQTSQIEGTISDSAAFIYETFVTVSLQDDIVTIIVLVGGSLFKYERDPAQLFIKGPPLEYSDNTDQYLTLKFELVQSWSGVMGLHSYDPLMFISDERSIIHCYEEQTTLLGETMDSFPQEITSDLLRMCMDSRWNSLYRCLAYLSGERIWDTKSKNKSHSDIILGLSGVEGYDHGNCIWLPPVHEVVNIDKEVLNLVKMRDDDFAQDILSTFEESDAQHASDIVTVNDVTFHIPHEGAPLDSTSADALSYMCSKSAEALSSNTVAGLSSRQQMDIIISVNTIRELVQQGKLCEASKRLLAHWKLSMIVKKMERGSEKPIPSSAFCWATVSDAQDQLIEILDVSQSLDYCVSMGAPLWIKSLLSLRSIAESIGKGIFQKTRDIKKCALMYCLANKVNTLATLCKAVNEPKLQQFFMRDFSTAKNRNAASANAYAAIGKGDIHYGCAFFLLAGDSMSAATVVVQRMSDWILGLLLIRLGYNDDPIRIQEFNDFLINSSVPINPWQRCILTWRTGKYIEGIRELWDEGTSESLKFLNYCSDSVTVLSRRKHEVLPPHISVKLHLQAARKSLQRQTYVTALRAHISLWVNLVDFTNNHHSDQSKTFLCSNTQSDHVQKSELTRQADFNTGQLSAFSMDSFGESETDDECVGESIEAPDQTDIRNEKGSRGDLGWVAWYNAADKNISMLIEMTKRNIRRIIDAVLSCEECRALRPLMCELAVSMASLTVCPPSTPVMRRDVAIEIGGLIDTAVNSSDQSCDKRTPEENLLYTALILQALAMVAVSCEREVLQYAIALSANNILLCHSQASLSSQLNIIGKVLTTLENTGVVGVTDAESANLLLIHVSHIIRRLICQCKMTIEDPLVAMLLQMITMSFIENSNDLILRDSFVPFNTWSEVHTHLNLMKKMPYIDKNELFNEIYRIIKKQLIPTSAEFLRKNIHHMSHLLASASSALCSFALISSVRLPLLSLWRRPTVTNMSPMTETLLTGSDDIRLRLPAEIQVYTNSNSESHVSSAESEWLWSLERHTPESTRRAVFNTAKEIDLIRRSKHNRDSSPLVVSHMLSNIIQHLDTDEHNGSLLSSTPMVLLESREISSICIDQSNFDNLAFSTPNGVMVINGLRDTFTKGNKEYVRSCQPQRDNATVTFFSSFPDHISNTVDQTMTNKSFISGTSSPEMGKDHTLSSKGNVTLMQSHPHLPVFMAANGSGNCSLFQFGSEERLSYFSAVSGSALSSIAFSPLGMNICLSGSKSGTVSLWRFAPVPTLTRVLTGHFTDCGGGITYLRDHGSIVAVSGTDTAHEDPGKKSESYIRWTGGKLSIIDVASSAPTICNIHLPLSNPRYVFHGGKELTSDILVLDTCGSMCIFDIRAGKIRPRELTPSLSFPQVEDSFKQKSGRPVQLTSAAMKLDDGLLALGAFDGSIYTFEVASLFSSIVPVRPLSPLSSVSTHHSQVKGTAWWPIVDMCFSPSGLLYASKGGKVCSIPVITASTVNMFV